MEPTTPLVGDYKLGFVARRLAQTLLGGPRIVLGSAPTPFYLIQAVLFLWPALVGGTMTAFVEREILSPSVARVVLGSVSALAFLLVEVTVRLLKKNGVSVLEDSRKSQAITQSANDDTGLLPSTNGGTVLFLFPIVRSAPCVIVYAVVMWLATAGLIDVTLPSRLSSHWGSFPWGPVLCCSTWISACTVLWSLTVGPPPETAAYAANPNHVSATLFRPFYLLLLIMVAHVARVAGDGFWWTVVVERNAVLGISFLPLLFLLGALPPLEALFHWMPEWLNTHLFGGSPMPSLIGTYAALFLSAGVVLLCLPDRPLWATLSACFGGFFLSLDLVSANRWPCNSRCFNRGDIQWKPMLGHATLLGASAALVALPHVWSNHGLRGLTNSPVLLGLAAALWACKAVQNPYVLGGLLRNPFYPEVAEVDAFKTFHRRFGSVSTFRKFLLRIVSPLAMVAYLGNLSAQPRRANIIILALARVCAFRMVWQRTEAALLDLSVLWGLQKWPRLVETLSPDPLPLVLLLELARQWLAGILGRCRLVAVLLFTSMSQAKQRLRFSWLLLAINVVFLPPLLLLIATSAFLEAPLLPLFSLPLFLPAFPRPNKFWPGQVGRSASGCRDSVYYEQMVPHFTEALRASSARGTLGSLETGSLLIGRLEERLLWIQVLESGYGFHRISVKGLELQETSCHAVEARKVDELYEEVFSDSWRNPEPFHSLLLADFLPVTTYSSVKGVLTGVVDRGEFPEVLGRMLDRALVWLLLRFKLADLTENGPSVSVPSPPAGDAEGSLDKETSPPDTWADTVRSLSSLGSTEWSDSDDPLEPSARGEPEGRSTCTLEDPIRTIELQLPLHNVWSAKAPVVRVGKWTEEVPSPETPVKTRHDSVLALPAEWSSPVQDAATRGARHRIADTFGESWFWKVLDAQLEKAPSTIRGLCETSGTDHGLLRLYRDTVALCHVALLPPDRKQGPELFLSVFSGDVPALGLDESPVKVASLQNIAVRAFRYAVKLALDEVLIAAADGDAELIDELKELDSDWFIGVEGSDSWEEAVRAETSHLFSIGQDPEQPVLRSHLLTLREVPVPVGHLHRETARGLWATLALELLYLTNDDDERYSIQAHPTVLRNLTVQAADPPLGYPIYASSPILLRTLW